MIFQLHWQSEFAAVTQFVCQSETDELDDPLAWAAATFIEHKKSRPPGWHPLVCWDDHPAMRLNLQKVRHPEGEVARLVPPPDGRYRGNWQGRRVTFQAGRTCYAETDTEVSDTCECVVSVDKGVIRVLSAAAAGCVP